MSPKEFTSTVAHGAAADLLRARISVPATPTTTTVIIEDSLQVIVTIARWEPMRVEPEVVAKIREMPITASAPITEAIPVPSASRSSPRTPQQSAGRLTPLQKSIVDVLAGASAAKPMKVSVLWIRLGRQGSPTGSFKCVLADLVRFGAVSHARGMGYWKTTTDDDGGPDDGPSDRSTG